jgi:hypothetical protein
MELGKIPRPSGIARQLRLSEPERCSCNGGARPPRAQPATPSSPAFGLARRAIRLVLRARVFGAGRAERQPGRPRSPSLGLHRSV